MVGWHHGLHGCGFDQALGVGEGHGGLECCSPWIANCWTRLSGSTTTTRIHFPSCVGPIGVVTPWTGAYQAPLSVGFSRQEYWSGVPFCVLSHFKSDKSCPTLCKPMDCSPSGPSVHGILQARGLEWMAMPFSRDIFYWWPNDGSFLKLERLTNWSILSTLIVNNCLIGTYKTKVKLKV